MDKQQLVSLYKNLYEGNIIKDIVDVTNSFSDEPPVPNYVALLNPELNFYNKNEWGITPTGTSFYSHEIALGKCIIETFEKIALFTFSEKNLTYFPYGDSSHHHMNLEVYLKNINKNCALPTSQMQQPIGWVKGHNISVGMTGFIPAQLVYPNYGVYSYYEKNNVVLPLVNIKNAYVGSAGGFDHHSTLLRAIYEHIERECRFHFMTIKSLPKRIDINKIHSKKINEFISLFKRYGFEIYSFNIMNDLEIPVIMTLLVDTYGVGQVINTGFYSNLKLENAIVSSLEDSIYQRFFYRRDITRNPLSEDFIEIKGQKIFEHTFKSNVFIHTSIYNSLRYIFEKSDSESKVDIQDAFLPSTITPEEELKIVISKLKQKGFDIWYTNLSIPHVESKDLKLYKVVIPGLQPSILGIPVTNPYAERKQSVLEYYKNSKYYV